MNKLAKSAIAAGVGTALFLGGGTTLALWNDAVNVGGAEQINSGVLTLDAAPGSWSASPDLWVPGDSFTYTTDVSIVAMGDNLRSVLTIDRDSISGDSALLDALDYSMSVTNVSGGTLTQTGGDTLAVTPSNPLSGDPVTARVAITVSFPDDAVSGLVAQGATAQLSELRLSLNQTIN